jgi:predicted site-specific integrase-resolvase
MSTATRPATAGPAPPIGDLLTSAELGKAFRVSAATIRRWHSEGRIPGGFRVGNQLLWPSDVIARMIAAPATTTT